MKSLFYTAFAATLSLFLSPARAHHGQEFFLLYDAELQFQRHGILQGNFSYIDEGTDDSFALSPSLSLGILPRTAFNLRADFTDEAGAGWAYRSIEPGLQFDLTPSNLKLPVRFGLSAAYQFAEGNTASIQEENLTDDHDSAPDHKESPSSKAAGHHHSTHGHHPAPTDHHSDKARTHEHAHESGHSHTGSIHNHNDNLFTARLILEADLTPKLLFVGNLISVLPEGGKPAWGYAVGLRQRIHSRLSIGVETLGDFDQNSHQEVLGAIFWEPMPNVLLKVGVGTGLSAISPDLTIRAGVLWMF